MRRETKFLVMVLFIFLLGFLYIPDFVDAYTGNEIVKVSFPTVGCSFSPQRHNRVWDGCSAAWDYWGITDCVSGYKTVHLQTRIKESVEKCNCESDSDCPTNSICTTWGTNLDHAEGEEFTLHRTCMKCDEDISGDGGDRSIIEGDSCNCPQFDICLIPGLCSTDKNRFEKGTNADDCCEKVKAGESKWCPAKGVGPENERGCCLKDWRCWQKEGDDGSKLGKPICCHPDEDDGFFGGINFCTPKEKRCEDRKGMKLCPGLIKNECCKIEQICEVNYRLGGVAYCGNGKKCKDPFEEKTCKLITPERLNTGEDSNQKKCCKENEECLYYKKNFALGGITVCQPKDESGCESDETYCSGKGDHSYASMCCLEGEICDQQPITGYPFCREKTPSEK